MLRLKVIKISNRMFAHLFITNSNKALVVKSLKQCTLDIKVNLTTKTKTYYEVLGVPQTATYNEIKSAYYELSLKYHPDKNKSASAKVMFQEVSNAYDILSKYDTRRKYDKTLLIKFNTSQHHEQQTKESKYPKKDRIYRPPSRTIYNFDEWLRCHYQETMKMQTQMNIKIEKVKAKQEALKREIKPKSNVPITDYFSNIIFLCIFFVTIAYTLIQRNRIERQSVKTSK